VFQKDFRVQELPLARIKKIMKLDEDVKVGGGTFTSQVTTLCDHSDVFINTLFRLQNMAMCS
jgi:hypothetical protein